VQHTLNAGAAKAQPARTTELPIIIAEIRKSRSQSVRVQLDKFRGRNVIDIRIWVLDDDGEIKPSRRGVMMDISRIGELTDVMAAAVDCARQLGLTDVAR
jgi:hypothetical protein